MSKDIIKGIEFIADEIANEKKTKRKACCIISDCTESNLYREDNVENKTVTFYKEDDPKKELKKIKVKKGKNFSLPLKGTCLEGEVVFLTETDKGYVLTAATNAQIADSKFLERTTPGNNVSVRRTIILTDEQKEFLDWKKSFQKCVFYCSDSVGYYIEIEKIPETVPRESCGVKTVSRQLKSRGMAVAYLAPGADLLIPAYFTEKSGIERNSLIPTEIRGNKVVFIAKEGECAVCSRPIKRDKPVELIKVCKTCADKNKQAGKELKENGFKYETLKAKIRKIG